MGVDWRGVYAIVDPACCGGRPVEEVADGLLAGGAAVLQLRVKDGIADRRLAALGHTLAERCRAAGKPFVVNDRPDIARIVGADGLHLGQDDLTVADARQIVGSMPIGVSTHDEAQVARAIADGADLIGFGPVFTTRTKERPDPVVGLETLRRACAASAVPVVAIGGITIENVAAVARAGAALVAAISALAAARDPEAATRRFREELDGW